MDVPAHGIIGERLAAADALDRWVLTVGGVLRSERRPRNARRDSTRRCFVMLLLLLLLRSVYLRLGRRRRCEAAFECGSTTSGRYDRRRLDNNTKNNNIISQTTAVMRIETKRFPGSLVHGRGKPIRFYDLTRRSGCVRLIDDDALAF